MLVIEKSEICRIYSKKLSNDDKQGERTQIYGILGIINIEGFNFLAVITEKLFVGKLRDGISIYEV